MSIELEMMRLQTHAKRDDAVREKLLATRKADDPYKSFCDAMLRSVNGGGTDSFGSWADFYGMFFEAIAE